MEDKTNNIKTILPIIRKEMWDKLRRYVHRKDTYDERKKEAINIVEKYFPNAGWETARQGFPYAVRGGVGCVLFHERKEMLTVPIQAIGSIAGFKNYYCLLVHL